MNKNNISGFFRKNKKFNRRVIPITSDIRMNIEMQMDVICLSLKRHNTFKHKKKNTYYGLPNPFHSHLIGSYGEVAVKNILMRNHIRFKTNIYNMKPAIGDFKVRNIYLEVKTRREKDWLKYGSQLSFNQYLKYLRNKCCFFIIWVSKGEEKVSIKGWNNILDFKGEKPDRSLKITYIKTKTVRPSYQLFELLKKK